MKRQEPCPRCQSEEINCDCYTTECLRCGNPVGNPTFTVCFDCYSRRAKLKEAELETQLAMFD